MSKLMELRAYVDEVICVNNTIKDTIAKLKTDTQVVMRGKNANLIALLRCDQMVLFSELFDFVIQHIETIATEAGPKFKNTLDMFIYMIDRTYADIRDIHLYGKYNKYKRDVKNTMRNARTICLDVKKRLASSIDV